MNKPSNFQLVTFIIAIISLGLNIFLLVNLNRGRLIAADALRNAGQSATDLADDTINYTFSVNQVVPIHADIPFNESITVPVNIELDEVFPVNVVVPLSDTFTIPLDATIPVDTIVDVPFNILGQQTEISIPIKADFPVNLLIDVPIQTEIPIEAEIPVQLPINTEIVVEVDRTITIDTEVPLDLDVPIDIALDQTPFGSHLRNLGILLNDAADQLGD
jgi:hypothetical protein